MNHYLVDVDLPDELSDEFIALIPEQRAQINELMASGSVISYALSIDQSKVWATINAESEQEVLGIMESMPLYDFMSATIYELAFYNATGNGLPAISMN